MKEYYIEDLRGYTVPGSSPVAKTRPAAEVRAIRPGCFIRQTMALCITIYKWNIRRFICLILFLSILLFISLPTVAETISAQPAAHHPFRLTFSNSMFHDVNQADIMAALKVWILTVAKDLNIEVDPNPNIKPTVNSITEFAKNNHVSGIAAPTPEILQLTEHFTFDRIAVGKTNGKISDEYLLLARRDSAIDSLEQLKGTSIVFLEGSYMSLSTIWLESLLLEKGLGKIQDFFSKQLYSTKPSQVVLPVFFGKQTVGVITREMFAVMGELNPQLGNQLRIIVHSPDYVAAGFVFIKYDINMENRDKIIDAMSRLDESEAGKQLLTLTHSQAIVSFPLSVMDESFALIRQHERLLQQLPQ